MFYIQWHNAHCPVIQFSSVTQLCPALWEPVDCSTSGFLVHHQLLALTQTHVYWAGDDIQSSHPLSSPSPPTFNLCQTFQMSQFFTSGGQSIGVSASASVLPMNIQDWFPLGLTAQGLLAAQGTLKSLLQHHSSKASIFQHSAFFIVQLSHPYMTTGKTIALTRPTLVEKVMSLLFNTLSRLVITFLPRSKRLFNFMAAITICSDFGPPKIKSDTVSTVSPSISLKWWDQMPWS